MKFSVPFEKHHQAADVAAAALPPCCRGCKLWESETLCLDCLTFSYRSYKDPDFLTPEQREKIHWEQLAGQMATTKVA